MEPYLTGSKFLVVGVLAEKNQRMVTIGTTVVVQRTRDVLRTWLFDPARHIYFILFQHIMFNVYFFSWI